MKYLEILFCILVTSVVYFNQALADCYDSITQHFFKEGTVYNPIGECVTHTCSVVDGINFKRSVSCPAYVPPPGCTLSDEDITRPYPDCCPAPVCFPQGQKSPRPPYFQQGAQGFHVQPGQPFNPMTRVPQNPPLLYQLSEEQRVPKQQSQQGQQIQSGELEMNDQEADSMLQLQPVQQFEPRPQQQQQQTQYVQQIQQQPGQQSQQVLQEEQLTLKNNQEQLRPVQQGQPFQQTQPTRQPQQGQQEQLLQQNQQYLQMQDEQGVQPGQQVQQFQGNPLAQQRQTRPLVQQVQPGYPGFSNRKQYAKMQNYYQHQYASHIYRRSQQISRYF